MSEALIGLAGVVLGAVIAGLIARATKERGLRAELNRYWAARLHDAAADLVASYTLARSTLAQARDAGRATAPADNELAPELRRNAQARLFTLPDGRGLQEEADHLRRTLDALHVAYLTTDSEWGQALHDQELSVAAFGDRVAQILARRSDV